MSNTLLVSNDNVAWVPGYVGKYVNLQLVDGSSVSDLPRIECEHLHVHGDVTEIAAEFLAFAIVQHITFNLPKLTSVGDSWMSGSTLKTFDSRGLNVLTYVSRDWMCSCTSLETFDTTGLTALTSVGDDWLRECSALESFDTTGLTALKSIGHNWLSDCTSLKTFNPAKMSLQNIGFNWLFNCKSLEWIGPDWRMKQIKVTACDTGRILFQSNVVTHLSDAITGWLRGEDWVYEELTPTMAIISDYHGRRVICEDTVNKVPVYTTWHDWIGDKNTDSHLRIGSGGVKLPIHGTELCDDCSPTCSCVTGQIMAAVIQHKGWEAVQNSENGWAVLCEDVSFASNSRTLVQRLCTGLLRNRRVALIE